MNCEDLNAYLDRSAEAALPADLQHHLSVCRPCQQLWGSFVADNDTSTPVRMERAGTNTQILRDKIFSDLKPVRPLPPAPIRLLFCLIPALLVVVLGEKTFGARGWEVQSWVFRALLFGAVGIALVTASYSFSLQMVPGALRRFSALTVQLSAAMVFAGTVAITFHHAYSFDMAVADEECFKNGLIISAAAFVLTFLTTRRGVWLDRLAASLQLAALASAAALLVLTLYCPVLAASHVFVAHFGAIAVTLLAGALIGRLLR